MFQEVSPLVDGEQDAAGTMFGAGAATLRQTDRQQ